MLGSKKRQEIEIQRRAGEILEVLNGGIQRAQREGVDRCVFHVQEMPGEFGGGFYEKQPHYPAEILVPSEKGMVDNKKSYAAFSLMTGDVGGLIKYKEPCVEQLTRERINGKIFVPWEVPSEDRFVNKYAILRGEEGMREFAEGAARDDATPEELREEIEKGINEYHAKTIELMEKAGVYEGMKGRNRYISSDDPHLVFSTNGAPA